MSGGNNPDLSVDKRDQISPSLRSTTLSYLSGIKVQALSILGGLAIWEAVGNNTSDLLLVGPSEVLIAFLQMVGTGEYWTHFTVSFQEFIVGYGAAIIAGISFGVIITSIDPVRKVLEPWVDILYSTPRLAMTPLFILWLGLGMISKVAVVFFGAFFPILINTQMGVDNVDPELVKAAKSFGATKFQIFKSILFPGAMPSILAGLRIGSARAVVGIVVAEFFGARAGLGYLIFQSSQSFAIAKMFVGIVSLAGGGLLIVSIMRRIENQFAPWKEARE